MMNSDELRLLMAKVGKGGAKGGRASELSVIW